LDGSYCFLLVSRRSHNHMGSSLASTVNVQVPLNSTALNDQSPSLPNDSKLHSATHRAWLQKMWSLKT
jgi:hypothetical protein